MIEHVRTVLRKLRPLRVVLLLGAIITIFLRPEIGTPVAYEGWGIVSSLLAPVLAPLFFMVLMLDALMSRVWMSEAEGAERDRLQLVVRIDMTIGVLLLIAWLPLFIALTK
ncbi:MAG: hypothetical protein LJE74_04700 [Proteobacteria bacterium]|jgi:hypothetical protein|nr:hypothetical protein [Pseudomonadota bacterium]MCG6934423.1 hypothetical protein [Pseudomonadota bacterium]